MNKEGGERERYFFGNSESRVASPSTLCISLIRPLSSRMKVGWLLEDPSPTYTFALTNWSLNWNTILFGKVFVLVPFLSDLLLLELTSCDGFSCLFSWKGEWYIYWATKIKKNNVPIIRSSYKDPNQNWVEQNIYFSENY